MILLAKYSSSRTPCSTSVDTFHCSFNFTNNVLLFFFSKLTNIKIYQCKYRKILNHGVTRYLNPQFFHDQIGLLYEAAGHLPLTLLSDRITPACNLLWEFFPTEHRFVYCYNARYVQFLSLLWKDDSAWTFFFLNIYGICESSQYFPFAFSKLILFPILSLSYYYMHDLYLMSSFNFLLPCHFHEIKCFLCSVFNL